MRKFQNLLFNDNVLCIVIEFDTRRVLDPEQGLAVRGDRRNATNSASGRLCRTRAATHRLGRPSRADQCST